MEISRRAVIGLLAASPAAFLPGASAPVPSVAPAGEGWMTADIQVLPEDLLHGEHGVAARIPGIVRRVHALVLGEERSGTKFKIVGPAEEDGTRISFFGKDGRPWCESSIPGFRPETLLNPGALAFDRRFDLVDRSMGMVRLAIAREMFHRTRVPEDGGLKHRITDELGWVRVEMKLAA